MTAAIGSDDALRQVERLSRRIGELLAGSGPRVQGAVLADLTATWLHGHLADSPEATQAFRAEILSLHVDAIRRLVRLADEESP